MKSTEMTSVGSAVSLRKAVLFVMAFWMIVCIFTVGMCRLLSIVDLAARIRNMLGA